jgi:formylglycine-generating enzyme required for sulfatase activity
MKKSITLIVFFLLAFTMQSFANGISIQKVSICDTNRIAKTAMIKFNISWDNSWRDSINWDAAWIFIKYREPKDSVWKYRHLTMSPTGNDAGTGTAMMKFAFPSDNKGVFYYRQSIGSGNIKMDSLKLNWNYGADGVTLIDSVELKVFATEMVYVPTGSFCIGDGNGTNKSSYSFQLKNAPNNYVTITDKWSPLVNTFLNINSGNGDDALLYNSGIRISGLDGLDISGDKISEYPDFPTGYRSFYCMKYEVSQGQYADFLNTLSLRDSSNLGNYLDTTSTRLKKVNAKYKLALQSLDPYFGYTPIDLQRHTIQLDSNEVKYTVTRPDRALGIGYQQYYFSFSDWSALRPITELEYEKACRGPLPPTFKSYPINYNYSNSDTTSAWSGFDWAWGNDTTLASINTMANTNTLLYNGIENGTENFTNYNIYKRYINPIYASVNSTGDGGNGPYRVGVFANDTSSRISSGATYYGIMDFSKNAPQLVLSIGSVSSRTFSYKKNGDGMLNAQGMADSNEFLTQGNNGPALMGGSFIYKQGAVSGRSNSGGNLISFRSVRSAPSDN